VRAIKLITKIKGRIQRREQLHKWLDKLLDTMPDGEILIEIKPTCKTLAQLRYYWVCLGIIANHVGCSAESLHEHIKPLFLPMRQATSTSELDKDEMGELIDRVIQLAAELDVVIPDLEEFKHRNNYGD